MGSGALAALVLLLASGRSASAQSGLPEVSVDPRMGIEFPVGDLSDIHTYGLTGGLGVAYRFHPNIAVRGDVDVGTLEDKSGFLTPSLTTVHYGASVEFYLPKPPHQDFPLTVRWSIGGGATSLSGEEAFVEAEPIDFSATYPTLGSAVKIGYEVTPEVEFFAGGQMYLIFADEAETAELYVNEPGHGPFGTTWSAPVVLGVKAAFR